MKVIQEGGEGLTEERLKYTFEKLRPEIRYIKHEKGENTLESNIAKISFSVGTNI